MMTFRKSLKKTLAGFNEKLIDLNDKLTDSNKHNI